MNCQNPFEVRSTIKTPEGFVLTYISLYSFKIIALLLSVPLLTPSELLRLTLRWLTQVKPSAACIYFWHPPTSYLSTLPLSAHNLSRTRFRARSHGTYRSPLNTSYAWDISHTLTTLYHPYAHEPSALTEYLKCKLQVQCAKR